MAIGYMCLVIMGLLVMVCTVKLIRGLAPMIQTRIAGVITVLWNIEAPGGIITVRLQTLTQFTEMMLSSSEFEVSSGLTGVITVTDQ